MVAKKKASGPSGAHTTARRKVTLSEEEQRTQDACANALGVTWAVWARTILRKASRMPGNGAPGAWPSRVAR